MLLLALVFVLFTSTYGTHTLKGMNSIERAKHIREVTSNQNHGKQLSQIGGNILEKEIMSGRSLSGRSLRESFYNQIVARSCGASACCSKKGGICMTNDQPCPGEVTDDCMGDYCVCCIPKCECPDMCQSSRCCTRKGGTCISADKTCTGKLRPRLCLGASCTCCIPVSEKCKAPFMNLGGECFYISSHSVNWLDARSECQNMSADLATPGSEDAMNDLLNQTQLSYGTFWVGGRYEESNSSYRWLTGETISSYWQPGHPEQSTTGLCVAFESQGSFNRGLIDWQCHNAGKFICKQKRK